jgi:hypothetical protein
MERGERARSGKFRQFWQSVKEAENEAEVRAVAIIQKQMPDNWRAALSFLERKFPKRWGRRMDVTSGDQPVRPTGVLIVPATATEEEWEQLMRERRGELERTDDTERAIPAGGDQS